MFDIGVAMMTADKQPGSVVRSIVLVSLTLSVVCAVPYILLDLPFSFRSPNPPTPVTDLLRRHLHHALFGMRASEFARAEVVAWLCTPLLISVFCIVVAGRRSDALSRWSRVLNLSAIGVHLVGVTSPPNGHFDLLMAYIPSMAFIVALCVYGLVRLRARRRAGASRPSAVLVGSYFLPSLLLLVGILAPALWPTCILWIRPVETLRRVAQAAANARAHTVQSSECWSNLEKLSSSSYPIGCGPLLPHCSTAVIADPCWDGPYYSGPPLDHWSHPMRVEVHEPVGDVVVTSAGPDGEFATPDSFSDDDLQAHASSLVGSPQRIHP
jgi:hypothetical protein